MLLVLVVDSPAVVVLLSILGVFAVVQVATLVRAMGISVAEARDLGISGSSRWLPTWMQLTVGAVTNFFDTLGIGNFAPTTAWFRAAKMVPDEWIPGTMNVGHTLPVILMAFFFIDAVEVVPLTLVTMIVSAVIGAWFGAGVVSRLPRRRIQIGMGVALLVAVVFMLGKQFQISAAGGDALGLTGMSLIAGAVAVALLGALMTLGVGLYAPCMVLISMLGMDPKASFPIMMGACAFLMPVASARFVKERSVAPRAALGLTLGGLPAVVLAAVVVKSLSLEAVRWLVIVVVFYTSITMLISAGRTPAKGQSE